ncbi:MAG: hypothetical protein WAM11_06235 [Cyanobium sp.]
MHLRLPRAPTASKLASTCSSRLPIGQEVTLSVQAKDRYRRSVAAASADINIGLAMVEDGQGCLKVPAP